MQTQRTVLFVLIVVGLFVFVGCNGSNEVDALIDEYEELVDQYIVAANKMKSGDADAITEMTNFNLKIQSYGQKLEAAKNEKWSDAQRERYIRVIGKFTNAMSEM